MEVVLIALVFLALLWTLFMAMFVWLDDEGTRFWVQSRAEWQKSIDEANDPTNFLREFHQERLPIYQCHVDEIDSYFRRRRYNPFALPGTNRCPWF